MSMRTLLVCPGRGAYTPNDLGTLAARRGIPAASDAVEHIVGIADAWRDAIGSKTITELDSSERFTAAAHMSGPNAGPLIYTCTAVDHALLDVARHLLGPDQNALDFGIVDLGVIGSTRNPDVEARTGQKPLGRLLEASLRKSQTKARRLRGAHARGG